MKYSVLAVAFVSAASSIFSISGVAAQTTENITACTEQQSLQQVIDSKGGITPDGCTQIRVTPLTSEGERLCLIDLSPGEAGVLGQLQDVARSSKYWVQCSDLTASLVD